DHKRHFRASEITEIIFRKYFATLKMRGNFDDTFFESINEVFICLVSSAMRHCLKSWATGVYLEPPKTEEFKYDTSVATWNAHPRKVRSLLLAAIKADLGARIAASQPKPSLESEEPLRIGDTSAYEAELTQELAQIAKSVRVARARIPDAVQHHSDQLEDQDLCTPDEQETSDDQETDNDDLDA
ncbi:hypothetical protein L211DRAFT_854692, partial [Terfezia boudieri ATCC MYA-4762]